MLSHKHSGEATYTLIDSQTHLGSDPYFFVSSPALRNSQTVKRIQRFNNIVSQVLGLCSVALSVGMDGILFYVLYKFYTTRSIPAPDANPPRNSPWANDTQLWPAFVLLISSTLTFIIDLVALIASYYSQRNRRAAEKVENAMTIAGYTAFVLKWIAVAVLYRVGKTTKDLWGWSCDERAQRIQQFYATELDFSKLCVEQVRPLDSWTPHLRNSLTLSLIDLRLVSFHCRVGTEGYLDAGGVYSGVEGKEAQSKEVNENTARSHNSSLRRLATRR